MTALIVALLSLAVCAWCALDASRSAQETNMRADYVQTLALRDRGEPWPERPEFPNVREWYSTPRLWFRFRLPRSYRVRGRS